MLSPSTGEWASRLQARARLQIPPTGRRAQAVRPANHNASGSSTSPFGRARPALAATSWSADGYGGTQRLREAAPAPARCGTTCRLRRPTSPSSPMPEADPATIVPGQPGRAALHLLRATGPSGTGRDAVEATWDYPGHRLLRRPRLPTLVGPSSRAATTSAPWQRIYFHVTAPDAGELPRLSNGACAELGLQAPTSESASSSRARTRKMMEPTGAVRARAAARGAGSLPTGPSRTTEPGRRAARALSAHGGSVSQWLTDFDDLPRGPRRLLRHQHCHVERPSLDRGYFNAFGNIKTSS